MENRTSGPFSEILLRSPHDHGPRGWTRVLERLADDLGVMAQHFVDGVQWLCLVCVKAGRMSAIECEGCGGDV